MNKHLFKLPLKKMDENMTDIIAEIKQEATKLQAAMVLVAGFVSPVQLDAILEAMQGEEQDYFNQKVIEIAEVIANMPTTYMTDGQGDEAIAYLHYFSGQFDWYIVEKDMLHEQLQAFGLARMWVEELGYINLNELRETQAELDLYWVPKAIKDIRKKVSKH